MAGEDGGASAGRYWLAATVMLLALCPNIVLTTAYPLVQLRLAAGLHAAPLTLQVAEGMSNAGYAFGAVLAAWLVQRFPLRPLFLATETLFVLASALAAAAPGAAAFTTGRVLQGATTGLLLVIALPPLVTRFPARRLPTTAALVDIGLFGAVTAGPLVGGLAGGSADGWRWLVAAAAGLGLIGLGVAGAGLARIDPFDPARPADRRSFVLAAAGAALPFFAVSGLTAGPPTEPSFWAPLTVGLLALAALVVTQYRTEDPLMPVRALSTSLPVVGTVVAMVAGAAFVTAVQLLVAGQLLLGHRTPGRVGLLFWPAVLGVALAAAAFGRLFATRWVPALVAVGLVATMAGAVVATRPATTVIVLASAGLLGFGAGATVSPGLFQAALGVSASIVGRAFALVELLRAEAAYLVGPVLLYVAQAGGAGPSVGGLRLSMWAVAGLTAAGTLAAAALFGLSGARPHRPDLAGWLAGERAALPSPATAELLRSDEPAEGAGDRAPRRWAAFRAAPVRNDQPRAGTLTAPADGPRGQKGRTVSTDTAHDDDDVRRQILVAIAQADAKGLPVTDAEIVGTTGLTPAQVEPALQQLVNDGFIVRTTPGMAVDISPVDTGTMHSGWVLLEAGREALGLR